MTPAIFDSEIIVKFRRFFTDFCRMASVFQKRKFPKLFLMLAMTQLVGCEVSSRSSGITLTKLVTANQTACAMTSDGKIRCWGYNAVGQLGRGDTENQGDGPGEMGTSLTLVDLGSQSAVIDFEGMQFHFCALFSNRKLKCWGQNLFGQLGLGDILHRGDQPGEMGDNLPFIDLGTGRTVKKFSTGTYHVCAILDNNALKCWGDNRFGALGLGDNNWRGDAPNEMGDNLPAVDLGTGRTAVEVYAEALGTCALLDNGALKCWGNNTNGELGLGDTVQRGRNPGEMGDSLPALALGTGKSIAKVSCSIFGCCALLNDGKVKCWGLNDQGQLGQGDTTNRGSAAGQMGDSLLPISFGTTSAVKQITAGGTHSCAAFESGKVRCWGYNAAGRLGLGDSINRGHSAAYPVSGTPFIDFGVSTQLESLSLGVHFSCATLTVISTKKVKCWGQNAEGELGMGDVDHRGDSPDETIAQLPFLELGL